MRSILTSVNIQKIIELENSLILALNELFIDIIVIMEVRHADSSLNIIVLVIETFRALSVRVYLKTINFLIQKWDTDFVFVQKLTFFAANPFHEVSPCIAL